ncbi:hypothetical protein FCV25MIE_28351 [Fagus crenata]
MTNFEINFLLRQGVNHVEGFDPTTPKMALSKERSKPTHCNEEVNMRPIEIEIIKGMSLGLDGSGGGGEVICEDVEGWFCKFVEAWIGGRRGLKREGFWVGIRGKKREEEDLW